MIAIGRAVASAGLLAASATALAAQQQFLNLDFELASNRVPNEPWAWRRIPWGAVVGSIALDSSVKHHGGRSLRLERSSGRPIGFDLRLPAIEADLRGKEVTHVSTLRPIHDMRPDES